jgi:hypothetical protein
MRLNIYNFYFFFKNKNKTQNKTKQNKVTCAFNWNKHSCIYLFPKVSSWGGLYLKPTQG